MPLDIAKVKDADLDASQQDYVCLRVADAGAVCVDPMALLRTAQAVVAPECASGELPAHACAALDATLKYDEACAEGGPGSGESCRVARMTLDTLRNLPLFAMEDSLEPGDSCYALDWKGAQVASALASDQAQAYDLGLGDAIERIDAALEQRRDANDVPLLVCAQNTVRAQRALLQSAEHYGTAIASVALAGSAFDLGNAAHDFRNSTRELRSALHDFAHDTSEPAALCGAGTAWDAQTMQCVADAA